DGVNAEGRGDHAVAPGRLAAALHMAQHGDARIGARQVGERIAQRVADAAIGDAAARLLALHALALGVLDRFGDDDEGEVAALPAHLLDMRSDRLHGVGDFRDQDHVGAAGDPGGERDVPGIAAHHLEHHDAVMARGGRLQAVEGFGCNRDRGVKADRVLGRADIVVDRLGNADEVDAALLGEPAQDGEAAIAADADERIEAELAHAGDDLFRAVAHAAIGHREGEGIAFVGGAEDRAAEAQDVDVRDAEAELLVVNGPAHQSHRAVMNAEDAPAIALHRARHDRADRRVEARAVAAARQNTNGFAAAGGGFRGGSGHVSISYNDNHNSESRPAAQSVHPWRRALLYSRAINGSALIPVMDLDIEALK